MLSVKVRTLGRHVRVRVVTLCLSEPGNRLGYKLILDLFMDAIHSLPDGKAAVDDGKAAGGNGNPNERMPDEFHALLFRVVLSPPLQSGTESVGGAPLRVLIAPRSSNRLHFN